MEFSFRSWWAVVALIISAHISGCYAQQCDANDSKALQEFKAGFSVAPEYFFENWTPGTNCCQWKGVNCTSSGRVRGLTINNPFARSGPSPVAERNASYPGAVGATLGDLSELQTLELSMILFDGPMPNTFDKLKKLEQLTLMYNNFSGSLSPSIGGATSLKSIRVEGQTIFWVNPGLRPAPIPQTFCQLKNLEVLALTSFLLTGTVPQCFCQFSKLTLLDLNSNNLEGVIPSCIGSSLGNLETLQLYLNRFDGPIPVTLSRLSKLQTLGLNENKLSGNIPPSLGDLVQLTFLSLGNNSLSGAIPATLGKLRRLIFLNLSINFLTRIPAELGQLVNLNFAVFSRNRLQGSLPPEIGNIGSQGSGLFFDISFNQLSGSIPDVFGSGKISNFAASNNRFTGGFPLSLARVSSVDVSNNLLSDPNPVGTLAPAPATSFLNLANNRLPGQVPSWLETFVSTAADLNTVDISNNKFTGPIPAVFFEKLDSFNASYNTFTGPLPEFSSSSLVNLDLSHNEISGPISSNFIGTLLNTAVVLDLSFNRLSGPLPANIVNFLSINYLDFSDNRLTGEVPPGIENIPSLEYLDLSNNNFTGTVPSKRPPGPGS